MALIMEMGMTAVAVYITLVATVIPILIKAGIPDIAAHFFAFYYGIISLITPPVALTAFAAAPLAGASPMATAVQASRLGAASFILPILFIYSPALLLEGAWWEVILYSFTALAGMSALAIAFTGYLFTTVPWWLRAVFLVSTVLLIVPNFLYLSMGLLLFAGCAALNRLGSTGTQARSIMREQARSDRRAPRRNNLFSKLMGRFVAAQLRRESEDAGVKSETASDDVVDIEEVTRSLMEDKERWGGAREVTTAGLWVAWGVVIAGGMAFELMGRIVFHATHPVAWAAIVLFISAAGLLGVVSAWRVASTRGAEGAKLASTVQ